MHVGLTRFSVNYRAPASGAGPVVSGRIEIDFQNGGSNSGAMTRYRLAYLQMAWGPQSLLAGQRWDTIPPLLPTPNADSDAHDVKALPRCCHDPGGFQRTPEEPSGQFEVRKCLVCKSLLPEVSRHQPLRKTHRLEFESLPHRQPLLGKPSDG